jgi:hypothetical protein
VYNNLQFNIISEDLDRTQNRSWPRYSYDKPVYQCHFSICMQSVQRKWTETALSKSKGYNCQKLLDRTRNIELYLNILMINLYTKFHFSMCNQCKQNKRKLLENRPTAAILPSSKTGIMKKKKILSRKFVRWLILSSHLMGGILLIREHTFLVEYTITLN